MRAATSPASCCILVEGCSTDNLIRPDDVITSNERLPDVVAALHATRSLTRDPHPLSSRPHRRTPIQYTRAEDGVNIVS